MSKQLYDVSIAVKGLSGQVNGKTALSFGSMEGSVNHVIERRFETKENVLEMMKDEKEYIVFTDVDKHLDIKQQYFFHKADILYVMQYK